MYLYTVRPCPNDLPCKVWGSIRAADNLAQCEEHSEFGLICLKAKIDRLPKFDLPTTHGVAKK